MTKSIQPRGKIITIAILMQWQGEKPKSIIKFSNRARGIIIFKAIEVAVGHMGLLLDKDS